VQPAAVELLTALQQVLARWGRWYVFGAPEFVRRTRVMPFVHVPTGMPLDLVLAGSGLEDEFLDRAVVTDIGGTAVPVIELGDLIVAKVLAGRAKDLDDASALWRLHGSRIDVNRVRKTLRLLEEALSRDLTLTFDSITGSSSSDP
jgi:hypothetical protein